MRGVPKWMRRKCRREDGEGEEEEERRGEERRRRAALRIQNEDPTHRRAGGEGAEYPGQGPDHMQL